MKDLIHDIELAEQFLNGTMTEPEKAKVAARLDADKEFNKLVQDLEQMVEGIRVTGNKTTIEQKILRLKEFAQKENISRKSEDKSVNLFRLSAHQISYAIAATVVFCAVTIFAIVNLKSGHQPDLYAKYFEPFDSPGSGITRSSENIMTEKAEAYEAYDAGNYVLAAELFEKALAKKDEPIAQLCLANAYMALNDFEKAEAKLIEMHKEHAELVTQTKWYLALVYIKQNKLEKARATLWEISDSSTYGEKAKKVLKELD
jgi:tetratricopeptide (TPR) repeat protein